ncbi:MAG: hypothetical protein U9O87_02355 [Verrucomicrobiota bacterium]|nr:hypothetical protein [Verrucomicrobiota bacterium]
MKIANPINKLEKVLSVFDQGTGKEIKHFLNFNDEDYPKEYKEIVRRLLKAAAETKVRQTMDIEDDILAELEDLERLIAKQDKTIENNKKTIQDKDKIIADLMKELEK